MTVHFSVADHVARVTIDRPKVLNAVDGATEAELERIWRAIEDDDGVRAVVLSGGGERAFCAGADTKDTGLTGLEYWAQPRPDGFGGIALRRTLDVPVIARVNGHALGGGFEMVLGCDLVVAVEEATFGFTEPRLGRIPLDGGMVLLQRQIPFRQAMSVLLTGRRIKAAEALAMGIVNQVVARAGLDSAVDHWLGEILACAPLSLRAIKQTVRRTAHLDAREARAQKLPALIAALSCKDQDEGVAAFNQKRKPVWQGR
ncbi:MAG: crotonase [Alphaproteobacteria bacterium]|nr:crotonase [Alphaproteobacteria bacterium]